MKATFTQQEILLITNNRFSQREWAEKNVEDKNRLSSTEQLEEACWNGLLAEMLPELFEKNTERNKLFLWHIRHCKSFLEIELGECEAAIESKLSIDPYLFFPGLMLS